MTTCRLLAIAAGVVFVVALPPSAADLPAPATDRRIVSAGLFKNGLAVVTEEVTVPGPGVYRLEDPPVPLYGSWWVESGALVEVRALEEMVEVPLSAGQQLDDLQRAMAGRRVELTLAGDPVPVVGRVSVLDEPRAVQREWDREYRRDARNYWFGWTPAPSTRATDGNQPSPFLVLERDDGTTSLIDRSTIARVDLLEGLAQQTKVVAKPVVILDVGKTSKGGTTVRISYLTKGIAWVASYRVDLSRPDRLVLAQQAVVRNELAGLTDTEIRLITGYPNVPFGRVTSPLSPTTTWSDFFRQLDLGHDDGHAVTSNVITQQAVAMPGVQATGGALPDVGLGGDGLDLHEQSIGRRDLAEGESLIVRTGTGEAPYERIVEWLVPDTRRADGRQVPGSEHSQFRAGNGDGPWDAVRFANPLGYPMTTAVATVFEDGRFQGQTTSPFTNPGSQVTLRITRALSLTTRTAEHEEDGERELVTVGGRTFRKVGVTGEVSARNHRGQAVTMVIRRRFSGELVEAGRDPSVIQLEEGVYSVNRRNELVWTVEIPPGETATMSYRYRVLVSH